MTKLLCKTDVIRQQYELYVNERTDVYHESYNIVTNVWIQEITGLEFE